MKRIIIVGGGPGGIAAAKRLRDQAQDQLEVFLIQREARAEYLAGTLATALGETPATFWQQEIQLDGVATVAGEVESVTGSGIVLGGVEMPADAVIAAPGLHLDFDALPTSRKIVPFWSPSGAAVATPMLEQIQNDSTIAIIISSLPYRCPPAPYSLAFQLKALYETLGRSVNIVVTTPEDQPLDAIGQKVPEFLDRTAQENNVAVHYRFVPDWAAPQTDQQIISKTGETIAYDLAFVVPPHIRSPLLRHLPGDGPLVPIRPGFESAEPGLYVIGDAAATPLPLAADVARAQGETAADAALVRIGLRDKFELHLPNPNCFVGHGHGRFSRISIAFPNGLPPKGKPVVTIDPPTPYLATEFEAAVQTWRAGVSE